MTSNDKNAGKYTVNFGPGTTIGKTEIGDRYNSPSTDTIRIERIDNNYVQQMENSLQDFIKKVNAEVQKENIPSRESETFQTSVNKLASTTKDLSGSIDEEKKKTIRERLKSVAISLVKMSPKIAQAILGSTPLAPFSNVVGETFENMVNSALNG